MFNINNYLEKFSKKVRSAEADKKQVIDIIEKHTQIKVPLGAVEMKNYIVYLRVSPAVSNKIFIHKNEILGEMVMSLPELKITDIR